MAFHAGWPATSASGSGRVSSSRTGRAPTPFWPAITSPRPRPTAIPCSSHRPARWPPIRIFSRTCRTTPTRASLRSRAGARCRSPSSCRPPRRTAAWPTWQTRRTTGPASSTSAPAPRPTPRRSAPSTPSPPGPRPRLGAINGAARIDAVDVPYKGTSNLLPALVGGTIDYGILEVSTAVPLVRANKLRALVVTSPARVATLEDVPTLAEAGLGEATLVSWVGLFAPAGTPQPVIDKLSMLALEFVQTPEAAAHFAQLGTIAYPAGASEFAKAIVEDQAQWKRYITAAGIQAE